MGARRHASDDRPARLLRRRSAVGELRQSGTTLVAVKDVDEKHQDPEVGDAPSAFAMGGLIWGVSSALLEATEIDRARARYYNTDLAEYLIPVDADPRDVEVIVLPEDDFLVNDLGIKGLGELGNVGTNAAVANAVYHATGVRVRDLPIRLEAMLDAPAIAL